MANRRDLIVAALATFCLAAALFVAVPTRSETPSGTYYRWSDINDDGAINILDAIILSNHFGTSGTPLAKAFIEYDSGWIDISDKAGQYITITHDLGSTDGILDITGKTTVDGGVHQRNLGGTDFVAGWNRTYGGASGDMMTSVVQTADGGYAMAGYTYSFGAVASDMYLVKTDASGNMQWNRTYGGTGDEWANSLVQTSDGGYALAGFTSSLGAGGNDFWLIKTGANGNVQWNKTYGGTNDEIAYSMVQTSDGGYAMAGVVGPSDSETDDFWMVKTDSAGVMQWNKTYGGADMDLANSVVQTSDGGYALAGLTRSFGASSNDYLLVKTNANGDMLWNKTYGGASTDYGCSAIETYDGGYAFIGWGYSFGPNGDAWLVKTDASGNMLWNKTYGGGGTDVAQAILQTPDAGYVILGGSNSFGAGDYDVWLVKTDEYGDLEWNRTYGVEESNDYGQYSIIHTRDGGFALACSTNANGDTDCWLIKTDANGNAVDGFRYGLAWTESTLNAVTVYRGTDDTYWNFVRVRVWKPETP